MPAVHLLPCARHLPQRVGKLLLLMTALAAHSCVPLRPAEAPRLASGGGVADPAQLYATIRLREDGIQTLRTRFRAVVHRGDEVRRADGVLVVKKPDRFRLRLLSPFGLTVFDYVSSGNHARMTLPLEGKVFSDEEIAPNAPFGPADLRPAFLRGDAAFPGQCVPRPEDAEAVIRCVDGSGTVLRETRIEAQAQTIRQETSFADNQARLITDFAD